MFSTGEGILTQKDCTTPDGLQEVFATNLFGHFLLVSDCLLLKYLEVWSDPCMESNTKPCFLQFSVGTVIVVSSLALMGRI